MTVFSVIEKSTFLKAVKCRRRIDANIQLKITLCEYLSILIGESEDRDYCVLIGFSSNRLPLCLSRIYV